MTDAINKERASREPTTYLHALDGTARNLGEVKSGYSSRVASLRLFLIFASAEILNSGSRRRRRRGGPPFSSHRPTYANRDLHRWRLLRPPAILTQLDFAFAADFHASIEAAQTYAAADLEPIDVSEKLAPNSQLPPHPDAETIRSGSSKTRQNKLKSSQNRTAERCKHREERRADPPFPNLASTGFVALPDIDGGDTCGGDELVRTYGCTYIPRDGL